MGLELLCRSVFALIFLVMSGQAWSAPWDQIEVTQATPVFRDRLKQAELVKDPDQAWGKYLGLLQSAESRNLVPQAGLDGFSVDARKFILEKMNGLVQEARAKSQADFLKRLEKEADSVFEKLSPEKRRASLLMLSCGASAPPPVHEGQPSIWHLADVLTWLRDSKRYMIDDDLFAMAKTNMQLNLAVAKRAADPSAQDAIAALV
jgi:hypothetical protein